MASHRLTPRHSHRRPRPRSRRWSVAAAAASVAAVPFLLAAVPAGASGPVGGGYVVTSPAAVAHALHWHHRVYMNRLAEGIDH